MTDEAILGLQVPPRGYRIIEDAELDGFGCRVASTHLKEFILRYLVNGRERHYTIGRFPDLSADEARTKARALLSEIHQGGDPIRAVLDNWRNASDAHSSGSRVRVAVNQAEQAPRDGGAGLQPVPTSSPAKRPAEPSVPQGALRGGEFGDPSAPSKQPDGFPSFRARARLGTSVGARDEQGGEEPPASRLRAAFTPTRPTTSLRQFSGRVRELERVIAAIEEERAHVVVYGDRGRGKTSFANVVAEISADAGFDVLRLSCNSETTFDSLISEIHSHLTGARPRQAEDDRRDPALAAVPSPSTVPGRTDAPFGSRMPGLLSDRYLIVMLDEFDRILDRNVKRLLAETIKNLSDISAKLTFMILGVAENLEDLLGHHPSIQRNIVGVHLPLMRPLELERLIRVGEEESGLTFDDAILKSITTLSRGLPYYAHLLCLHSCRATLNRGSSQVEGIDLQDALDRLLSEFDHRIVDAYDSVTAGRRRSFSADVLYAAALAPADPFGRITAAGVVEALRNSLGRNATQLMVYGALGALTRRRAAPLVRRHALPGRPTYSFADPAFAQYTLMRQSRARGLV